MIRSIAWIEEDTKGHSLESFAKNRRLRQLVERNIEIVSEASRRLPDKLKAKFPDIPWKAVAGIGNVMRHDYEEIAPKILWDVVRGDLKDLKRAAQAMLREIDPSRSA